jgi:hypothetical protein
MRALTKPLILNVFFSLLFAAIGTVIVFSGCAKKATRVSTEMAEEPYGDYDRVAEEDVYKEVRELESPPETSFPDQQRREAIQSRLQELENRKARLKNKAFTTVSFYEGSPKSAGSDQKENFSPDQTAGEIKNLPDSASRAQKRMVHYDGSIKQRSPDPEAILDSAKRFVRSIGGVIVSFSNQSAVFNVPVEKFRHAFDSLCTFAEVIAKSISAEDITEQFRDVEVRIKIAKATIERLKALIAKEENDTVKIRLLNEVKMISETLERLTRKREILQGSAEYSTIRLEVLPYHPHALGYYRHELRGFQWINEMTPLNAESRATGCYLKLSVPAGMVQVKSRALGRKIWRASSADGAEFWGWKRKNKPKGTTEFWFSALVERKKNEYADLDTLTAGTYKIVRLRSYGAEPYVYCIGVSSQDKKVNVVEAYFPSQRQEERYTAAILAVLAGGTP